MARVSERHEDSPIEHLKARAEIAGALHDRILTDGPCQMGSSHFQARRTGIIRFFLGSTGSFETSRRQKYSNSFGAEGFGLGLPHDFQAQRQLAPHESTLVAETRCCSKNTETPTSHGPQYQT